MCDRQIMGMSQIVHACVHVCHTACVLRDNSQRGKERDRRGGADYDRTGVSTQLRDVTLSSVPQLDDSGSCWFR